MRNTFGVSQSPRFLPVVYKCIFSFGQREAIESQKYVDSKNKIQFVSINTSQAPTLWQVLRILK